MFKEFVKLYKPHKRLFALDIFSSFMMSAIDLAFPVMVSYIIDTVIPIKNMNLLFILCLVTIGGYLLRYVFEYIVSFYGHMLGVALENDLRKQVFSHFETLSFSYFDSQRTGQIISRLTTDIFDISEFSHHGPEDLSVSVFILIGSFAILISTNVTLTAVLFTIIPIMIITAILNNTKWEKAYMNVKKVTAELTSTIEDSFSGVRVVKAFTSEGYQYLKFAANCDEYSALKRITYKFMALFVSNVHFFTGLLKIVVIFLGGYLIYLDKMTVGVLIEFSLYIDVFVQPVKRFTSLIEDFQKAKTGFKRCREILQTQPAIKDDKDCIEAGKLDGELEFKNVSFSYGNEIGILDDFSLKIAKGETVAIVGPSGAGKTTLCSLIPRFYEVNSGEITIDNINIKKFSQRSLRENIGIVQQDVFLFNGSIKENIAYGKNDATDEDIKKAASFANLDSFIEELPNKYDTIVGERGVKLSGGQKQRVSIARIFLKNPPILILDEATSSLDNENEKIIQESFDKLSQQRTTLIIAHRLQTIEKAGRIIVMKKGRIVEEGTHSELLNKKGIYAKLYSAQLSID